MTSASSGARIPSFAIVEATTALPEAIYSISLFCMPPAASIGFTQTWAERMRTPTSGTVPVTVMPFAPPRAWTSGAGSRP